GSALFESALAGGIGAASYQWQYNDPVLGWTNVPFATNTSLSIQLDKAGTYEYRVAVTMSQGCDKISNSLSVVVSEDPSISIVASESEVCVGAFVSLSAAVSNGSTQVSYHWQESPNGSNDWT